MNAFRVDLQQQLRIDLTAQREQLTALLLSDENRSSNKISGDSSTSSSAGVSKDNGSDEMDEWVGLEKIRAGEFGANMLNDLKVRFIFTLSYLNT